MGPYRHTLWPDVRVGGHRVPLGWVLALGILLAAALIAAVWAPARPLMAGACAGAGVMLLALLALGARRAAAGEAMYAEASYADLQTGMLAMLKDAYVRGALPLADYEAHLRRALEPNTGLTTARVPLRLAHRPDTAGRRLAGAGGILLLATGLALAWPAVGPDSAALANFQAWVEAVEEACD